MEHDSFGVYVCVCVCGGGGGYETVTVSAVFDKLSVVFGFFDIAG